MMQQHHNNSFDQENALHHLGYNEIRSVISCVSIVTVCVYILIRRHQVHHHRGRAGSSIRHGKGLIFPIYYTFFFLTLALEITTIILLWIYNGVLSIYLSAFCWAAARFTTEGLSIFLLHNGVGMRTIKRTSYYALVWAIISYGIWCYIPILRRNVGRLAADALSFTYLSCLLLFYLLVVFAPLRWLPRRPATLPVALLMSFLLSVHIIKDIMHVTSSSPSLVVWDILSLSLWFIYPWVIYMALSIDSDWWQGLYTNSSFSYNWSSTGGRGNLNQPLLEGDWGSLLRASSSTLATMMSDLESCATDSNGGETIFCPVVPFGHIKLRTDMKFRSGSNSRVYVGELGSGRRVAVKMLFSLELDQLAIKEFYEEAKVLSSLRHNNIISCIGVSIMPPALCMVLEFCELGSLYEYLKEKAAYQHHHEQEQVLPAAGGRVEQAAAAAAATREDEESFFSPLLQARFMRDCVAGLEYMHSKGYVHCDIKSLNYLVTSDLVVKLGDVGEAMPIASEPTRGGGGGGGGRGVIRATTLNWSAPEILAGHAHRFAPSLDMYSLGLVMYEILELQVPFNQETWTSMGYQELIQSIVQGDRPCLRRHHDGLEAMGKLKQVIMKCWDGKPEVRPTATEVHRFLLEYIRELETEEEKLQQVCNQDQGAAGTHTPMLHDISEV